eukprot:s1418_g10.t2
MVFRSENFKFHRQELERAVYFWKFGQRAELELTAATVLLISQSSTASSTDEPSSNDNAYSVASSLPEGRYKSSTELQPRPAQLKTTTQTNLQCMSPCGLLARTRRRPPRCHLQVRGITIESVFQVPCKSPLQALACIHSSFGDSALVHAHAWAARSSVQLGDRMAPLGLRFQTLAALALLSTCERAAFHDDDCELASNLPDTTVSWKSFRELLLGGCGAADDLLEELSRGEHWRGKEQCELGVAAACLCKAHATEAKLCIRGISLQRMLATRWPVLKLLADLQKPAAMAHESSCSGLQHPSLNWDLWLEQVTAYAEVAASWLQGDFEDPPTILDTATAEANGVVWKSSSGAIAEGRRIAEWTAMCPLGILAAYAVRAAGLVLGHVDVYRIVQRAIETAESAMASLEGILESPWPIFKVLHAMSLMKRTFHDLQLSPEDLEASGVAEHSDIWTRSANTLRSAAERSRRARGTSVVVLTGLPHQRAGHLLDLFKHADKIGYLAPLVIVPLEPNVTESCSKIVEVYAARSTMPEDWYPCLPFLSRFQQRAQYLSIYIGLQLGLPVLWFDFHVVFLQDPFQWLPSAALGQLGPPRYRESCQHFCLAPGKADLYLADEFYAAFLVKPTLIFIRPTEASVAWLRTFLLWLCTFPFAHEARDEALNGPSEVSRYPLHASSTVGFLTRGLQFMVFPDRQDVVPSVSMLPPSEGIPRIVLGELDAEQRFVSSEGWFGEFESVASFEISGFLPEADRLYLLETLRTGNSQEIHQILLNARKTMSPRRATDRSYRRHEEGSAEEPCSWHYAQGAYLGGFADSAEETFQKVETALCKCLHLGGACKGITCEAADGERETCTLRKGLPFLAPSPTEEIRPILKLFNVDLHTEEWSFVKVCRDLGCNATPAARIVHANFADGCCEREQAQSSESALRFGASENRPLRGDFLDDAFRRKNEVLLNFNRTPELTQHKTPSGKVGYYVWKPYVVLRTLLDPSLPWETTVVVWTDAGIHFVSDMRPLIHEFLRDSDVAATRTPMNEGDFSKRDAFVLLDADFPSIMETNQIATGHPLTSGVGLLRTVLPAADQLLKDAEGAYPSLGHKFTSFPKFIFRPRTGRINWRLLHSLDLDRVVREGDIDTIQAYLDNITYSRFSREDLEVTSDDGLIKVVQLAQLCMEYLNSMCASSQQLIQGLSERVRIQAAQLKAADAGRRRSRPRRNSPRESRGPPVGAVARKCTYCSKRFQSEQYLNEHLMRRHMADAFPIRVPEKAPSPVPHEFAEPSPARSAGLEAADISETEHPDLMTWAAFRMEQKGRKAMKRQSQSLAAVAFVLAWPWSLAEDVRHQAAQNGGQGFDSKVPSWPEFGSGVLCYSSPFLYVTSREACQQFAQNLNHSFYAHRADLRPERCISFESCVSAIETSHEWKLFRRPLQGRAVAARQVAGCADTWLPDWTDNATSACELWSRNQDWGALHGGQTLSEACEKFWAQLNCAKTCGQCGLGPKAAQALARGAH